MNDEIKKGLVGVISDETKVSEVMPEINSLTYRGYAVQELCEKCNFEQVAYLLLHGELPNPDELKYIANVDKEFEELIEEISNGPEDTKNRTPKLDIWLTEILSKLLLPSGPVKNWTSFVKRDENLANSARLYLLYKNIDLPENVPYPEQKLIDLNLKKNQVMITLLDRYIRHGLLRSKNEKDHELAEVAIQRLRMLGHQITETGMRPCA